MHAVANWRTAAGGEFTSGVDQMTQMTPAQISGWQDREAAQMSYLGNLLQLQGKIARNGQNFQKWAKLQHLQKINGILPAELLSDVQQQQQQEEEEEQWIKRLVALRLMFPPSNCTCNCLILSSSHLIMAPPNSFQLQWPQHTLSKINVWTN